MHDIKYIRNNFDIFKKQISKRNDVPKLDSILDFDKKNRQLIQEKEKLEQEKKSISKLKDKNMFQKSKDISEEIKKLSIDQMKIKSKLNSLL